MFCTPPATTTSIVPDITAWAAKYGLLRRAALAIERHAGHVLGRLRASTSGRCTPIGAHRVDVAEHDIIDGVRIDAGTLDERGNGMRADVGGMDLRQAARGGRRECGRRRRCKLRIQRI